MKSRRIHGVFIDHFYFLFSCLFVCYVLLLSQMVKRGRHAFGCHNIEFHISLSLSVPLRFEWMVKRKWAMRTIMENLLRDKRPVDKSNESVRVRVCAGGPPDGTDEWVGRRAVRQMYCARASAILCLHAYGLRVFVPYSQPASQPAYTPVCASWQ